MSRRRLHRKRKGNIMVLSAIMIVVMMAMLAFAIDLGYLCLARDELQRAADSAAIAAAWDLIDEAALTGDGNSALLESKIRSRAGQFASLNNVLRQSPGLGADDVAVGFLCDPSDPNVVMDFSGTNAPNAVTVRVRRTTAENGEVPFFIARVLGIDSAATQAEATAALLTNLNGFRVPSDGSNLEMMPFAVDEPSWTDLIENQNGYDNWAWDPEDGSVRPGQDGIRELNLYPLGTGCPGNRGTVDIGSSNNSTNDIARQIVHGVSPQDLEYHGGELKFDQDGNLYLNGDTGISAGVKDELASIIGKPKFIPIFREVTGPGNNCTYTIVNFAGIRILGCPLDRQCIEQACDRATGVHRDQRRPARST